MNKNNHENALEPAARRRNWKHIHHSTLFWIGVLLFLAAAAIYVLSDNLAWRPHIR